MGWSTEQGRQVPADTGESLKKPVFSEKGEQWPDCMVIIMNTGQDDLYKRAATQALCGVELPTLLGLVK